MKLGLDLKVTQTQTLTPQQIQYLKLLQLPVMQLEQHVQQEIEQNPMLEDESDEIIEATTEISESDDYDETPDYEVSDYSSGTSEYEEKQIDDDKDPFEFNKLLTQDDSEFKPIPGSAYDNDEDNNGWQFKNHTSLAEDLSEQLRLLDLSKEELLLGENIIGNIDDDGYLRRTLQEILDETNSQIAEFNFTVQQEEYIKNQTVRTLTSGNPAANFALNSESRETLEEAIRINDKLASHGRLNGYLAESKRRVQLRGNSRIQSALLTPISYEQAENILKIIQQLDPPGIASRDIQECLTAQLKIIPNKTKSQQLALDILTNSYDAFIKKHYNAIKKTFKIDDDELRAILEEITSLNPKPGGSDYQSETNTVIPDFMVYPDEDSDELMIEVNDSRLPRLKLNQAYEALKKEAKQKKYNKDTKTWLRNKYEDAKFLIQAIRQRKNTMLKVMTAIVKLQRDFFDEGKNGLKPLIYKNIADQTGLDISTVCRIVNGKYVQTQFGTFELKFFFSEALPTDEGEEVSTTVIKEKLRELIEGESKSKPLSDDKISAELKKAGFNVARRTVAKYREQLKIPVARLRKELV